ncbi:MAG: hypothetical protein DMF71_17170, partial [Acidobacteria bacterium]
MLLSLAFVPPTNSAADPKDGKDSSASTKSNSRRRDLKADDESVRERDNRPTSLTVQPSAEEKTGKLQRIDNFFKRLFVSRDSKAAKENEQEEIDNDDADLPAKKFMQNRIDKDEYMRLRDEYISSLRGLDPLRPLNPELRVSALNWMQSQQAEIARAAQGSKGQIEP